MWSHIIIIYIYVCSEINMYLYQYRNHDGNILYLYTTNHTRVVLMLFINY